MLGLRGDTANEMHWEAFASTGRVDLTQYDGGVVNIVNFRNALDAIEEWNATSEEGLSILLRLLSPIAPHITHHLWRELKFGEIYVNRAGGDAVHAHHAGLRHSGLGGEDGKYGLDGYFQKKTVYVNFA